MHTLPVTCNQILGIIMLGLFIAMVVGITMPFEQFLYNLLLSFVPAFILFIVIMVFGIEWLEKNVKCKCK